LQPPISQASSSFAVHAKDEEAQSFYRHFDFFEFPSDPMHFFLLLRDLRSLVGTEP